MPLEKPLPQNSDAERSILGAILLDNTAILTASKLLNAGDFFHTPHRVIWRAMLKMHQAGEGIDLVTLVSALDTAGELRSVTVGEIQGAAYIASLGSGMPRVSNIEHYAKIVKDAATRRAVIHLAAKVQDRAREGEETPAALLATIQKQLSEISPGSQTIVGGNGKLTYSLTEFLATQFPTPEHLIDGFIPKSGSAMVIAMPHHLKSWFTTSLALGSTVAGVIMGKLTVQKPVRTLLVSVEDFPGELQWRIRQLMNSPAFSSVDPEGFRVLPRPHGGIDIMQESWYQRVLKEIESHKADHVIFDVLRRVFGGDINSPKESSALCEQFDRIRDVTGAATTIVHHENRKAEDIMRSSAGSFNFPGWANVLIRFQRKTEEVVSGNKVSHVEIEVDNKLASSPDPVRLILDLTSDAPVRLEELEDTAGISDLREALGEFWTVNDLSEVLGVHKSNAKRRLKKMIAAGLAEKFSSGKRGRQGGLARYQFVGTGE